MGKQSELTLADLNGNYSIAYQAKAPPIPGVIWYDHTEASAKIVDGKLTGSDIGGSRWSANINLLPGGDAIEFGAHVDPSAAPNNTFLMDKNGTPTRIPQDYVGALKVTVVGNNVSLHGTVDHGKVSIEIHLKRMNDAK